MDRNGRRDDYCELGGATAHLAPRTHPDIYRLAATAVISHAGWGRLEAAATVTSGLDLCICPPPASSYMDSRAELRSSSLGVVSGAAVTRLHSRQLPDLLTTLTPKLAGGAVCSSRFCPMSQSSKRVCN